MDGLAADSLGKLNITRRGMQERNQMVLIMLLSIRFLLSCSWRWIFEPISHTIDAFTDLFVGAAITNEKNAIKLS